MQSQPVSDVSVPAPAPASAPAPAAEPVPTQGLVRPRETGVVMAVKDAYGFIRCAQREDKVFFHFSELINSTNDHEVDRGDEVAFDVVYEPDSGRFSGVNVELLPPGSVVFEEISEIVSTGIIERELQGNQRAYGRRTARLQQEPFGGRIRAKIADVLGLRKSDILQFVNDDEVLLEFSGRDVTDPRMLLQQGDQVQFRLFTELRSGRQGATAVTLEKAGGNRETGVVVSLKDSYGFLKCADRDCKQMFFHFSELLTPDIPLSVGVELEFEVALNKKGQLHATRVIALEPGSVQFSVVEPESICGVISQPIKHIRTPSGKTRRTSRPGSRDVGFVKVSLEHSASLAERDIAAPTQNETLADAVSSAAPTSGLSSQHSAREDDDVNEPASRDLTGGIPRPTHEKTLSFCGSDLMHPRIELMQGDRVEFKVAVDKRTRAMSATDVVLVQPCPDNRERGIISVLKPQYGFIRCEKRSEPLFFHFNEFISAEYQPQLGDEIEFNVHPDNRGQDNATRITLLPQGSVVFDFLELNGVVVAAAGVAVSQEVAALVPETAAGAIQLSNESVKQLESQMAAASILAGTAANSVLPSVLGDLHVYVFELSNLLTPKTALRVGDDVCCVFSREGSGRENRLSALRILPKHGTVESISGGRGTIRLVGESGEVVGFSGSDVAGGVILRVGDEVSMQTLTYNSHTDQRTARLVERLKQASPEVADALANTELNMVKPKRTTTGNRVKQMNRMARGPDGTRGFAAGRGKPIASA